MTLVVITGGVRSGKSALAERVAASRGGAVRVVAFGDSDGDPEMAERIARHRAVRPAGWRTEEPASARGWVPTADAGELLVLDCLGALVARVLREEWDDADGVLGEGDSVSAAYARRVEAAVDTVVDALLAGTADCVVVTNEVGDGLVPAYPLGRLFRDALGRANRRLVTGADAAWLVVAGRAVDLASLPGDIGWPED